MNCRTFERQVPDWLSGRLSAAQSEAMKSHVEVCGVCARVSAWEAQIRSDWKASQEASPALDLWPRIAVQIDRPKSPPTGSWLHSRSRWAMAAALGLLALGIAQGGLLRYQGTPNGQMPIAQLTSPPSPAAELGTAPHSSDSWVVLRDVPQSDPRVDDPVGANMENVWTCLNTDSN